ncbi:MAG: lipoprotein [Rhizobiales bacterium]|nr:lipoprotein [Hyphomicrobiales bacterium]
MSRDRLVTRITVAGVLAIALVLAACGRKSGLDLPPSASVAEPAAAAPSDQSQISPDGWGPDGRPVAPKGASRRTPLDWLID